MAVTGMCGRVISRLQWERKANDAEPMSVLIEMWEEVVNWEVRWWCEALEEVKLQDRVVWCWQADLEKKTVELELELMSWAGTSNHRGRNGMEEIKHYHYLSFHLLQRTMANHVVSSPLVSFSTLGKKDLCTQLPQVLCVVIPLPQYIHIFNFFLS